MVEVATCWVVTEDALQQLLILEIKRERLNGKRGVKRNNGNRKENHGDASRDGDHGLGLPDTDEGPEDPDSAGETKETTNSPSVSFSVVSKIYSTTSGSVLNCLALVAPKAGKGSGLIPATISKIHPQCRSESVLFSPRRLKAI